ncbi:MAG: CBS domain-containing protein [Syntrophales bacterium]|jgi:CBS domain-containing protein|nr:CBS domain-containing protein [Syntrophales bacterium]MDD4338882.1 CBS domain-containing protein [Syntrophales bacterium]HOG08362.1 CBS domain-containing protein [Syntrophales bacterium]HOS77781.1 CBS domain-containing protein [Syntrophales bacterium]HPB69612.1 CBS domain-containing protein [Syntrophales bacterium]
MQRASDLLKGKSKQLWTVLPEASVLDALKLMAEKEIGALVVMDKKEKVVGIFTERDYARKIVIKGKNSLDTRVKEVMTPFEKMYTVKPDTRVEDCMVLMTGKHIRHVPVFDGPKFLGLISIGDAVKAQIAQKDALIDHLSDYIGGKY